MRYLFLFGLSFFSATVQTVTGFGYGIIVMSVLPLFLPMEQALAIATVMSLCLNAAILSRRWRSVQLKLVWLPTLCAALGAFGGLTLIAGHPSPVYRRVLGVFLLLLAGWFIWLSDRVRLRPTLASSAVAGVAAGVCGGLFSISGPPMVLYYVSILHDIERYMATTQLFFLLHNVFLITMRGALHLWPHGIAAPCMAALGGLLCGCFLGGLIFRRADQKKIKRGVYLMMALSGLCIALGL